MSHRIYGGPGLTALQGLPDGSVALIYFRLPPAAADPEVERPWITFGPWIAELQRILAPSGLIYCHCRTREVHHYRALLLDPAFGRQHLLNELIWTREPTPAGELPDGAGRWPEGHDNVLVYAADPSSYTFNAGDVDHIPYMAPDLVGAEKQLRGKLPTDTWWHTQAGYPAGFLARMLKASSAPGDLVLDVAAGDGLLGQLCLELRRRFVLLESSGAGLRAMAQRFRGRPDVEWIGTDPDQVGAAGEVAGQAEGNRW